MGITGRAGFACALLALAAAACVPPPMLPAGAYEQVDLNLCYIWPNDPGPDDKTLSYFVLSDGRPSFQSLKWVPTVEGARSRGCDAVVNFDITSAGFTVTTRSAIVSAYSLTKVGSAETTRVNFSYIAQEIYRSLSKGTPAYQAVMADKQAAAGPPPEARKKRPRPSDREEGEPAPWWKEGR